MKMCYFLWNLISQSLPTDLITQLDLTSVKSYSKTVIKPDIPGSMFRN